MRNILFFIFFLAGLLSANTKPRVIVTTDGEIDDKCSFVRFLLYTNDMDVAGLIYVNSKFHYPNHDYIAPTWMPGLISKYGSVHANLLRHDPSYPSASLLLSKVKVGNMKAEGGMAGVGATKDTEGSNQIVNVLLDSDTRPVWIQAWGGMNTVAQAFYRIKTSQPTQLARAVAKARIYSISDQDFGTSSLPWLSSNFAGLQIIKNMSEFLFIAYPSGSQRVTPSELAGWLSNTWMRDNIRNNHGVLCSAYPRPNAWAVNIFPRLAPVGGDAFISEGDSPAFFHTINTGLRSHENPSYGGWGNRFAKGGGSTWTDVKDGGIKQKSGYRWLAALQADWQARADWCVKSTYASANHQPRAVVAGALDRIVAPGSTVSLSSAGSSDPDGNAISVNWWQYYEADSASAVVAINNAGTANASFVVPNELGKEVHIILEVKDNGTPALTRYQRVICKIRSGGTTPEPTSDTHKPTVPGGITATAQSSSSILVGWSAATDNVGVTGYDVYRGTSKVATVTGTSYTSTGLTPSTAYSFKVQARDAAGNLSEFSAQVSSTTLSGSVVPPPPTGGVVYEAEAALVFGATKHSTYVDYINNSGDYIEWTINAATARSYSLGFKYAFGTGNRPLEIKVDGVVKLSSLSFPATGSTTTYGTVSTQVTLSAGLHKVRATAIGMSGGNMDSLTVTEL